MTCHRLSSRQLVSDLSSLIESQASAESSHKSFRASRRAAWAPSATRADSAAHRASAAVGSRGETTSQIDRCGWNRLPLRPLLAPPIDLRVRVVGVAGAATAPRQANLDEKTQESNLFFDFCFFFISSNLYYNPLKITDAWLKGSSGFLPLSWAVRGQAWAPDLWRVVVTVRRNQGVTACPF